MNVNRIITRTVIRSTTTIPSATATSCCRSYSTSPSSHHDVEKELLAKYEEKLRQKGAAVESKITTEGPLSLERFFGKEQKIDHDAYEVVKQEYAELISKIEREKKSGHHDDHHKDSHHKEDHHHKKDDHHDDGHHDDHHDHHHEEEFGKEEEEARGYLFGQTYPHGNPFFLPILLATLTCPFYLLAGGSKEKPNPTNREYHYKKQRFLEKHEEIEQRRNKAVVTDYPLNRQSQKI
ncbi:hypothetical protein DFA_08661 [Cavenderia fasciculata]|uniref:Uncharacterized protein n=1 Tax=Cavenderia fasciculata TaxID=261658 RepID=F4Q3K7_CACFS|nr:uncharacterized protein DFA_08661 [Cavenderia fasciculata]EGG17665.1 hypothetical protein DFA_08661 [Cavenderia fasciculata]|eukprot:XP_004356149.1 hypothetical protein DFA_08661 [Cavenderia fasciculata]